MRNERGRWVAQGCRSRSPDTGRPTVQVQPMDDERLSIPETSNITSSRRSCLKGLVATALMSPAAARLPSLSRAGANHFVWPEGAAGAISLSYDDGLDSQLDRAVPALRDHGLKATFYVTLENIRERQGAWARVPLEGHELANHSVHHPCDLSRFNMDSYRRQELEPVERWLDQIMGAERVRTFAYPCDVTDLGRGDPNQQAAHFARDLRRAGIVAARTSEGVLNSPSSANHRPYRLQALALGYDASTLAQVVAQLDIAARHGLWVILVCHGVGDPDEGSVSVAFHEQLLHTLATSPLWMAPVGHVFQYVWKWPSDRRRSSKLL